MLVREIHWEATNRCNLQCKHCLPASGPPRSGELTSEEAMAALTVFKNVGVSKVFFTGGEPFVRRDFPDLLERAVDLGMEVSILTNATLLGRKEMEILKRFGARLGVSLEGADDQTNDAIRGTGSFRRATGALKRCREYGIPTTLYVTVTAKNVGQLSDLARLAKTWGCVGVHYSEVTLAGRALEFTDELALSVEQKECMPGRVGQAIRECFGEGLSEAYDECWANPETLYMTADGNLYVCSEVFQRRPDDTIGNIRSLSLKDWEGSVNSHGECCYGVRMSEHAVLVNNTALRCAFAPGRQIIETLEQLNAALDQLYQGIERDCRDCQYPDCMGYIWLLKEDVERLYELGVPLVQVNNGPMFIHSFPIVETGQPDLSVRYPSCSQLCDGNRRCNIHRDRPLVCRLYPIGLETQSSGTVIWVLHQDCLHVRNMEVRGMLPDFERRANSIISNISPELMSEIVETYCAVDSISAFPDGENNYSTLQEV